jgi:hypothetical protein
MKFSVAFSTAATSAEARLLLPKIINNSYLHILHGMLSQKKIAKQLQEQNF